MIKLSSSSSDILMLQLSLMLIAISSRIFWHLLGVLLSEQRGSFDHESLLSGAAADVRAHT